MVRKGDLLVPDRSRAVRSDRAPIRSADGARPGSARERAGGCRARRHARRPRHRLGATARSAGGQRQSACSDGRGRQGRTRPRETESRLHQDLFADRRQDERLHRLSGQSGARQRSGGPHHDHRDPAGQDHVQSSAGEPAASAGPHARERADRVGHGAQRCRSLARDRRSARRRQRHSGQGGFHRQHGRCENRHDRVARDLRKSRSPLRPGRTDRCGRAARDAQQDRVRAARSGECRTGRTLCVRHRPRQQGRDAAGRGASTKTRSSRRSAPA